MNRDIARRLDALEAQENPTGPPITRITRTIIAPGTNGPEKLPVTGWQCGNIKTRLRQGETENDCWNRHNAAINTQHGKESVLMTVQLIGNK